MTERASMHFFTSTSPFMFLCHPRPLPHPSLTLTTIGYSFRTPHSCVLLLFLHGRMLAALPTTYLSHFVRTANTHDWSSHPCIFFMLPNILSTTDLCHSVCLPLLVSLSSYPLSLSFFCARSLHFTANAHMSTSARGVTVSPSSLWVG